MRGTRLLLTLGVMALGACVFDLDFVTTGGTTGTGAAPVCTPGATMGCYDGPAGTEGVGICKAGLQTCAADGKSWGACAGEVLPQPVDCASGMDLHCDGQAPACTGTSLWAKSFGDPSEQSALSVATDASDNVYVTGFFQGSIDFGAPADALVSAGGYDVFVASFDANGGHRWSKRFGDAADQSGTGVAVDPSGNVLLSGKFLGSIDFGGGVALSSSKQGDHAYVAKLGSDGSYLWSKGLATTNVSVAADTAGDVLLAGDIQTVADFGCGMLTTTQGAAPFIAKLDGADGSCIWSRAFEGTLQNFIKSLAVDASGDVLVTGNLQGTVDFGGGTLASVDGEDVFVAKFDAGGGHVWSKAYGDDHPQEGRSIAADPEGFVYVTGSFYGSVDFGGTKPLTSAQGFDAFLAKLDPATGAHVWSRQFDTGSASDNSRGWSVAVDPSGRVVLTGEFGGTLDFSGGTDPLPSAGSMDAFLAKLDPDGKGQVWSARFGGGLDQVGTSVAVDGAGNVLLTGNFFGAIYFGPPSALTSAGGQDIFLAQFAP